MAAIHPVGPVTNSLSVTVKASSVSTALIRLDGMSERAPALVPDPLVI